MIPMPEKITSSDQEQEEQKQKQLPMEVQKLRYKVIKSGDDKDVVAVYGFPDNDTKALRELLERSGVHVLRGASGRSRAGVWSEGDKLVFKTPKGTFSETGKITYATQKETGISEDYARLRGWVKDPYVYETSVARKAQIQDIEDWAARQEGVRVERVYAGSETEAKAMAASGGIPLRIVSEKPLPETLNISVRSDESVRQEIAASQAKILGQKIYDDASPVEKAGMHAHTLLSIKGTDYAGAATREVAKLQPVGSPGWLTGKALDVVFPKIKTTEEVVVENFSEKLVMHSTYKKPETGVTLTIPGDNAYTYSFDIPLVGRVNVDERIVHAVNNPVVEVETMALGGAGAAKIGATKIGSKILASTAGKVALGAGAAGFYGSKGYEVLQLKTSGDETKALGTVVKTIAGTVAGTLAYRAETAHIIKNIKPKDVDLYKIKGQSVTKQQGEKSESVGKFKVVDASDKNIKGLKVYTRSVTKGKQGGVVAKIPEQKLKSGLKIAESYEIRHTDVGKTLNIKGTKIYNTIAKEGRVYVNDKAGPLVGKHEEQTLLRETGRIVKATTDRAGKATSLIIRKLTGIGRSTSAKDYHLYLVSKGDKMLLIEDKLIGQKGLAKIDWVDVSKVGGGAPSYVKISPTGASVKPTAVPSVKSVVPTISTVKVSIVPDAGVRIVPTVNPTPAPVRIKRLDTETVEISKSAPQILKPTTRSKQPSKSGTKIVPIEAPAIASLSINAPGIMRAVEKSRKAYSNSAQIYHPITGQAIDSKTASRLEQKLEPIIDRIASQPVPTVPVRPNKPAPVRLPYLVPYLRLGKVDLSRLKFSTGHIKNPVPDIEKVI